MGAQDPTTQHNEVKRRAIAEAHAAIAGIDLPQSEYMRAVRKVPCPRCGAAAQVPCWVAGRHRRYELTKRPSRAHPSREEIADVLDEHGWFNPPV